MLGKATGTLVAKVQSHAIIKMNHRGPIIILVVWAGNLIYIGVNLAVLPIPLLRLRASAWLAVALKAILTTAMLAKVTYFF
tara:strand:- start:648 stop:890 length:243 start_codon:yes stop_codon:yes gene_type:complete